MTRQNRGFLRRGIPLLRALLGALLFVFVGGCGGSETSTPVKASPAFERAPVILISIDTLRSDHLPAYGYRGVETPAIDAIRRESILFERAYAPTPMTLPSHVSMLSGMLPGTHGVRNNLGYTFDETKTFYLPCYFKSQGYATGAAVSTYVLRRESGMDACFDLYEDAIDPRGVADHFTAQQRPGRATLEIATDWIAPRVNEPFFFFFHIYEPHVPYDPPEPYKSRYASSYDGEIALADEIVGKLVDELRARGAWDRAIVVLTSDHGEGLGDHGEEQHSVLLNRELIQVPLLIKLPGGQRGGEAVAAPVQLSDLAPTIVELSGGAVSVTFDGESLLGTPSMPDRLVFSETLYPRIHLGWSDLASLVQGRFHYIEGPRPELYDVVADPAERNNLVDSERRTTAAMRKAIEPFRVPMKPLESIDPETAKKMAALGYVGSPSSRSGSLPDPKEHIGDLETIRRAMLLGQAGRVREAEAAFRALLAENPAMVEGWAKLGDALTDAGETTKAADAYREAVRVSPIAPPDLLLDAGHAALRAERFDEAASLAEAALPSVPTRAWSLLARVEIGRGRFAEAERAARQAQREPPQPADLVLIATAVQKQGRFDDALSILAEADKLAASSGIGPVFGLSALRADTLARQGDMEGATRAFQAEIENFPSHLRAWNGLCVLRFIDGDKREAYRLLEEMVAKNPGPAAKLYAARTLEGFEDPEGAARWRERAAGP